MLMCKGLYVILQDGPPIEKASSMTFIFYYLEPMIFIKRRYKDLFSLKKERGHPLYTDQRKRFFSLLLREKFSRTSCFSGDKGTHTSSADQTWVITWKIIGDSLWSNKRGGDESWSNKRGGDESWSNRSGGDGSWSGSLNHFSGKI